MLYYLSQYILKATQGTDWQGPLSGLRVFQYITFRSAGAAITALLYMPSMDIDGLLVSVAVQGFHDEDRLTRAVGNRGGIALRHRLRTRC